MRRKSPPKRPRFKRTTASRHYKDSSKFAASTARPFARDNETETSPVTASAQPPIRQKRCQGQQGAHDQKETLPVLSQGNTTYIHAKQARHQVDRQGQHSYYRQHKQCAIGLFIDKGGQFFLKLFDPLNQGRCVADGGGERLCGLVQVLKLFFCKPIRRPTKKAQECSRYRGQKTWEPNQRPAQSDTAVANAQKTHWKAKNATTGIHPVRRDLARSKTQPPLPK